MKVQYFGQHQKLHDIYEVNDRIMSIMIHESRNVKNTAKREDCRLLVDDYVLAKLIYIIVA